MVELREIRLQHPNGFEDPTLVISREKGQFYLRYMPVQQSSRQYPLCLALEAMQETYVEKGNELVAVDAACWPVAKLVRLYRTLTGIKGGCEIVAAFQDAEYVEYSFKAYSGNLSEWVAQKLVRHLTTDVVLDRFRAKGCRVFEATYDRRLFGIYFQLPKHMASDPLRALEEIVPIIRA